MFAVGWAVVPVDGHSPWGQRTGWLEAAEVVEHPTDYLPYHPLRHYDPASNTCCPSWPADRQDTETVVAAVASGGVPDVGRMVHRHYLVAPCHAEQ